MEASPDRWGTPAPAKSAIRNYGFRDQPQSGEPYGLGGSEAGPEWGRLYIVVSAAPLLAFTCSDRTTATVVEAPEPTTHARRQRNA